MRTTATAFLMLILACITPTGVVDPNTLRIDLVDEVSYERARNVTLSSGVGQFFVEGVLVTPGGGYELSAVFSERPEQGYTLTILAEFTEGGIPLAIPHIYTATVSGLMPGAYTWTIEHQIVGIDPAPRFRVTTRVRVR
jgi:hypothetical protein